MLAVFGGFILTVSFQNCGKIQPGLNVSDSMAVLSDGNNNLVGVIPPSGGTIPNQGEVKDPAQNQPVQQQPAEQNSGDKKSCDRNKSANESENSEGEKYVEDDSKEEKKIEEVNASVEDNDCAEKASKFKVAIDVDQLESNKKLSVSGKVFIYSKSGQGQLDDLSIERADGRTVLCNVDVSSLSLKNGRLELINSRVRHLENQNGRLIKDQQSRVD